LAHSREQVHNLLVFLHTACGCELDRGDLGAGEWLLLSLRNLRVSVLGNLHWISQNLVGLELGGWRRLAGDWLIVMLCQAGLALVIFGLVKLLHDHVFEKLFPSAFLIYGRIDCSILTKSQASLLSSQNQGLVNGGRLIDRDLRIVLIDLEGLCSQAVAQRLLGGLQRACRVVLVAIVARHVRAKLALDSHGYTLSGSAWTEVVSCGGCPGGVVNMGGGCQRSVGNGSMTHPDVVSHLSAVILGLCSLTPDAFLALYSGGLLHVGSARGGVCGDSLAVVGDGSAVGGVLWKLLGLDGLSECGE